MTNNRLIYLGGRATGLRPDTLRLALDLDPDKYEDHFLQMTRRDQQTYATLMGNPHLAGEADQLVSLRQRAALAFQAAMAEGVVSVEEYEKFRFMLPVKETYMGLTDWLVRIREKRPALEGHLSDDMWKEDA